MSNELEILHPVKKVRAQNLEIEVRELPWGAALAFLKELSEHLGKYIRPDEEFAISAEVLRDLINGSEILASSLACKSTGMTKEEIDKLSISVVFDILDAALELNLSEEVMGRAKKLGDRLRVLAPAAAAVTGGR